MTLMSAKVTLLPIQILAAHRLGYEEDDLKPLAFKKFLDHYKDFSIAEIYYNTHKIYQDEILNRVDVEIEKILKYSIQREEAIDFPNLSIYILQKKEHNSFLNDDPIRKFLLLLKQEYTQMNFRNFRMFGIKELIEQEDKLYQECKKEMLRQTFQLSKNEIDKYMVIQKASIQRQKEELQHEQVSVELNARMYISQLNKRQQDKIKKEKFNQRTKMLNMKKEDIEKEVAMFAAKYSQQKQIIKLFENSKVIMYQNFQTLKHWNKNKKEVEVINKQRHFKAQKSVQERINNEQQTSEKAIMERISTIGSENSENQNQNFRRNRQYINKSSLSYKFDQKKQSKAPSQNQNAFEHHKQLKEDYVTQNQIDIKKQINECRQKEIAEQKIKELKIKEFKDSLQNSDKLNKQRQLIQNKQNLSMQNSPGKTNLSMSNSK